MSQDPGGTLLTHPQTMGMTTAVGVVASAGAEVSRLELFLTSVVAMVIFIPLAPDKWLTSFDCTWHAHGRWVSHSVISGLKPVLCFSMPSAFWFYSVIHGACSKVTRSILHLPWMSSNPSLFLHQGNKGLSPPTHSERSVLVYSIAKFMPQPYFKQILGDRISSSLPVPHISRLQALWAKWVYFSHSCTFQYE